MPAFHAGQALFPFSLPFPGSLAILGGIVLIRTFLSFSPVVEIEGRRPWEEQERIR